MRMHSRQEFQTWLAQDLDVRDELYALMGGELDSTCRRWTSWNASCWTAIPVRTQSWPWTSAASPTRLPGTSAG